MKINFRIGLIFELSLIIFLFSYEAIAFENYGFNRLTIDDGLSQSSIQKIFQDKMGFIWFGTKDGLNRYDSYNFKVFITNQSDSTSISNNNIIDIDEDADGYLWIATLNGLNKYDPNYENFERLNFRDTTISSDYFTSINSVLAYRAGEEKVIWFSTRNGVFTYQTDNRITNRVLLPLNKNISGNDRKIYLHKDRRNDIWAFTNMEGIFKLNKSTWVFEKYVILRNNKPAKTIQLSKVFEDDKNNFWFGSIEGLNKFNPFTNELLVYKSQFDKVFNQELKNSFINAIVSDKKNLLWIATSGFGLVSFNPQNKKVEVYTNNKQNEKSISHNVVNDLYLAKDNTLWLGTDGKGINKLVISKNNFNLIKDNNSDLSITSVRSFFEDRYGFIWISGYDGLDRYQPSKKSFESFYSIKQNLTTNKLNAIVYTIIEDKDNPSEYLYLGTEGSGIYRYSFKKNEFTQFFYSKEFAADNIILSLFDDGEGNLWFGTNASLVKLDKKSGFHKRYVHQRNNEKSISPEKVTAIYLDSENKFWIGTSQGGLNLMDRINETFTLLKSIDGIKLRDENTDLVSGDFIKSIYEDSKRNLWIGTTNGLYSYNKELNLISKFDISDGLPNNVVYGILEDNRHNLWLSTNFGISMYNPENELFRNFNFRDGLQSNEFNTNAYLKTKNGNMYFGGINGFNWFDPSKIIVNDTVPKVVLSDFKLFNNSVAINEIINDRVLLNKSITIADTIELYYSENVFIIEFTAIDYKSSGNNFYQYRLYGFQNDWQNNGLSKSVTYTNLNPGEYIFQVKASDRFGNWNNDFTELLIIVKPPFWLTWWFFSLAAITIISILYGIYKYRVNNLIEMQRLRLKIASDLHDEVGSTLTKVSMRAQMLEMQLKESSATENLNRISEQAREAVSTMQDIVWSIDSRNDSFNNLMNKIKDTAFSLLAEKKIRVNFKINGFENNTTLKVNERQNIYLILKEALHNISKHSNANEVNVVLDNGTKNFTMIIKDNGSNFTQNKYSTGQGLQNMEMRSKKLNGIIEYKFNNGFEIKLITAKLT